MSLFQRRLALKACASEWVLYAVGYSAPAWAQPLALSTLINRSDCLRALSQRFVKAYAQLVLGILPERSQEVMAAVQHTVKASLAELGRAGFSTEISALLDVCIADAERLLGLVAGAPAAARLAGVNTAA